MLPSSSLLLVFALIFFSSPNSQAALPTIQELLTKMKAAGRSTNEQLDLVMKIKESDGSTKERAMIIKKKSGKDQKAMVKLQAPTDLKGIALLTIVSGGKDQSQWLYIPAEKRSRRIVGSNKKGRFLDSELSFEDMNISTYENYNNTIKEDEKDKSRIVIVSTVKNQDESSYSKMTTWLDAKSYRLIKADYYDEEGKLLKTTTFNNYKQYGKAWRPQSVSVKNVQKNRSTVLELKKVSFKKIDDDDFSMSALEEG